MIFLMVNSATQVGFVILLMAETKKKTNRLIYPAVATTGAVALRSIARRMSQVMVRMTYRPPVYLHHRHPATTVPKTMTTPPRLRKAAMSPAGSTAGIRRRKMMTLSPRRVS
jgi:hypothetical protein